MSDPARFFAALSLVFGALLIVLTPPFQTPDEPAHLYRAWSISEGRWFGRGGAPVPRSLVEAAAAGMARPAFARTPLHPTDRVFVPVVADAWKHPLAYTAPSYTPLGYAATAPAILLGRLLSLSPVALVYLGRAANLILSTLILAFTIRRAPFGRWALALFALTPMCAFMRGSLAVDALTIACAALLIVEMLRGEAASSIALSVVVAAIKPGYAILPLFAFGVRRLRARRAVMALIIMATLIGVLTAIFWMRAVDVPPEPSLHIDPRLRATSILHHPFEYLGGFSAALGRAGGLLAIELVADFGWVDAPAPLAFALIWIAALIAVAVIDGPAKDISRAWSLILFVAGVVAISTVMYLYAPPEEFFRGLQGRYFLPLLPLALLPLCARRATERAKRLAVAGLTALATLQSAWVLIERYW